METNKGSFTIIDIYESVQRVLFLITPSQSVLKNVDFFRSNNINSNMHRHVALHSLNIEKGKEARC